MVQPLRESVMIGHSTHSFSHQGWRSELEALSLLDEQTSAENPTIHSYCSLLLKQTPILLPQR